VNESRATCGTDGHAKLRYATGGNWQERGMSGNGENPAAVFAPGLEQTARRAPVVRREGAVAIGATAMGAVALGALALGALAIGKLAIGRLAVGRAKLRSGTIDDLRIERLTIAELRIERLHGQR
jgi:hypothetical protein